MIKQHTIVALDFETHLIGKDGTPIPKPIVMSFYKNNQYFGLLKPEDGIEKFLKELLSDNSIQLIFHNAAFDLSVAVKEWPSLYPLVVSALKNKRIHDTKLVEKLFHISIGYEPEYTYTLANLVKKYLDIDISKSKEDGWRLRYEELEYIDLENWPQEAIDYAKLDAKYTYEIFVKQDEILMDDSLHVSADFFLKYGSRHGLPINLSSVERIKKELENEITPAIDFLIKEEFLKIKTKEKPVKNLKKLREYIQKKWPSECKTTQKGTISVGLDSLEQLPEDPIIDAFKVLANNEKLLTSYLPKLRTDRIWTSYDVLKETGRTSCREDKLYPSLNIQQIPRNGHIKECFIPDKGYSLIEIDYCMLEACSFAHTCYELFGFSQMRDKINNGLDIHKTMGAAILSQSKNKTITYDEIGKLIKSGDPEAKVARQLAKAANFGFPGGMGPERFVETVKNGSGLSISIEQASILRELFFEEYPEARKYFSWVKHQLTNMDSYSYNVLNFERSNCSFCACANGRALQTPAALGAKLAICRIINYLEQNPHIGKFGAFIHDSFLLQLKNPDDIIKLSNIMINSMSEVLFSVRLGVEWKWMDKNWDEVDESDKIYQEACTL